MNPIKPEQIQELFGELDLTWSKLKCKKHPRYCGIRKPRTACLPCLCVFLQREATRKAKNLYAGRKKAKKRTTAAASGSDGQRRMGWGTSF